MLLGLLLVVSVVLSAVPVSWGLPSVSTVTWAFDEVSPEDSATDARARHKGRYPPLHYYLLAAANAPFRLAGASLTTLQIVSRCLSVLMGVIGVFLMVTLTTRAFSSRPAGLVAGVVVALSPVYVYYSKLANLDVPYLMWFVGALIFYLRVVRRLKTADFCFYALFATFAVCTKDQAVALFALPTLALVPLMARAAERGSWPLRWFAAVFDPRLLLAGLVAMVAFLAIHNVLFDLPDFLFHLDVMLAFGGDSTKQIASGLTGQAELLDFATRNLLFVMGALPCAAALAGVALAVREPRHRHVLLLLLFPLSYYLTFIATLGYTRDRQLMPVMLVLAVFAGLAAARALDSGRMASRLAALSIVIVAISGTARSVAVDAAMWNDSRYAAERWARDLRDDGENVAQLFDLTSRMPRDIEGERWGGFRNWGADYLASMDADHLLLHTLDLQSMPDDVRASFTDGRLGYQLDTEFRPFPRLERLIPAGVSSNLSEISPVLWGLRRVGPPQITHDGFAATSARLFEEGGEGWNELAAVAMEAAILKRRRWLAGGAAGVGLTRDGWTLGTNLAVVMVSNPGDGERSCRVRISSGRNGTATQVRLRGDGIDEIAVVGPGEPLLLELPAMAPGEARALGVRAFTSRQESGREVGVRVQVKTSEIEPR